jgi:cytochrome b561
MPVNDTPQGYGLISRLFHWLMALAILAMFGIGLWMMSLDYYSPYYNSGREFHKSVGILLLGALALRFGWRLANVKPDDDELGPVERKAARTGASIRCSSRS